MITAHKVLAAYGCLAPRVVTGQFDPTAHKAVWPSTGNYCRGGVAISRILGCRSVAVLPEGMSRERFDWLERWVADESDIIRTVGTESNVKEIYDKCAELDATESNIIFNQFCEFGNHLVHLTCTGKALHHAFQDYSSRANHSTRLFAYISATGSAGTLAAGDYLKDQTGSLTVAVEALECPTLLYNGFGEHNIQGIGDKHVPYIHNVSGTDAVAGITDGRTDSLGILFNSDVGRRYLVDRRGIDPTDVANLSKLGLSGIGNVLAAIKTAKYYDLGPEDVLVTVATDDYDLYASEYDKVTERDFANGFDTISAAEVYGRGIMGLGTDHYQELSKIDRDRIFNLGYFTWVEQQGVSVAEFEARRRLSFWRDLRNLVPQWDELINEFNAETGVSFA
jgi:cysteine synthase A